ncbi:PepSY-associated TM helix domain-containing protein [Cognatishimia activa]|uniref:PepSY domain-containing protein n=1 Tax=Cognatishimia activa TaxID=1715691 RepID=A0A975ETE3_9RHOB|nr:PepSY domain-containing protein [Cognatishimia activa]QTN36726.1 PepSY domain-containing protein [Cognatishimia activa]
MTDATAPASPASYVSGGALYRLVWKWHFLASLYVLPFMAMLALTGGIYLYKPQIENWLYADYLHVQQTGAALPLEIQVDVLREAHGITRLRGITQYDDPTRSTKIEYNDAGEIRSFAWVNPYSGEVLGSVARDEMPMRMLKKFHGELLLGKTGTKFVELAAHWAIVMFITGAYLWWPRGKRTLSQAVAPPKGGPSKGRSWWRETHLFTGFLAVVLVTPILVSGLPWTDVWGGGLSQIQKATGQNSQSMRFRGAPKSTSDSGVTIVYEDVFAIARQEGLKAPYEMRPPRKANGAYWIRSASTNRNDQTELVIDRYSGDILKRLDFQDNPAVAKTVSLGISFHQGELYGLTNLIQNTVAAILALLLSVTGFVAWWKRRPAGSLGVPNAPDAALSPSMIALVVALSILFPLVGASLIVALILDWAILRRLR